MQDLEISKEQQVSQKRKGGNGRRNFNFLTTYYYSNNSNNDNNQNQFSTQDGSTMTMQDAVSRKRGWKEWYCIKDGGSFDGSNRDHFSGLFQTSSIYTRAWLRAALEPSCSLKAVCQAQEELTASNLPPTSSLLSEILR